MAGAATPLAGDRMTCKLLALSYNCTSCKVLSALWYHWLMVILTSTDDVLH